MTPSEVGARAEFAIATALVAAGYPVFLPLFNGHGRVDLVYEDRGRLVRMQCKTSRLHEGYLNFRTCSNTANVPKSYEGEIDVFGVYSPERNEIYVVPVEDVPTRAASLRLERPRNNQDRNVRWAAPYLLRASVP